ncbi:hypothetical protein J1G42_08640 [Cellulomonas sp. zg-ZUI222]|uniref:Uncharacterized protein n=1 Tax=Cellulomonas wangleii TaxID=2816956 RepID=A0ABX8D1Q5_9CELL|nr:MULTISPECIES: hypothetical protein [Cellulomonas]MBO0900193.1 hypothetical protein [Cellulomonas sp. zg-ZUI22]MBO0920893.1 hypothetical protein [Cellulomonas wangleii]MBO0925626.1 hypothetical protein [Cellulomonas wangleii]QVI60918.1 hypothetical protein KG103_10230 [Cellulomonas wangleii]
MLYHIRVVSAAHDLASLADFADVVAAPTPDGAALSCRLPDAAALTGLVALLTDLGLTIAEIYRVPDDVPPPRPPA